MIVYHGSKEIVNNPDIYHSRKRVDFGPGFYVTPLYNQAKDLCARFTSSGEDAYISTYSFDDGVFESNYKVLEFQSYSDEWLDFVANCRMGTDKSEYDVVIGGVANDKVFDTVELYFENLITKEAALGRLQYEKPNMQFCIRTQEVLDKFLHFEGSEKL